MPLRLYRVLCQLYRQLETSVGTRRPQFKGDTQLAAVWTDPDFDPFQHAVYYTRVIEIPTPRWTTFDAMALGIEPPSRMFLRPSRNVPGLHRSGIRRKPTRTSRHKSG